MAISAPIQTVSNQGTGSTLALTVSAPSNGNIVTMCVAVSAISTGQVSSITQTGVTWTKVVEGVNVSSEIEFWVGTGVSSAGTTATINFGSSVTAQAQFMEFSGLRASPTDVSATSSGTNTTTVTMASVTSTNANDLIICASVASSTNPLASPTSSFTLSSDLTTAPHLSVCYRIVSSTGTYSTTLTFGPTPVSVQWATVSVALKGLSLSGGVVAGSFGW